MKFFMKTATGAVLMVIKTVIGAVIAGAFLTVALHLETGTPVMELAGYTYEEANNLMITTVKTMVGKLPFIGYFLDAFDITLAYQNENGYGVFHDCLKMLYIFICTDFLFGMLSRYIRLWKWVSEKCTRRNIIVYGMYLLSNIALLICVIPSAIYISTIISDVAMRLWLEFFGNGVISNWALFIVTVLMYIGIYWCIKRKKRFISSLTMQLINFGLVLCVITLFLYIAMIITNLGEFMQTDSSRWYFGLLSSLIGGLVLLEFKIRRK